MTMVRNILIAACTAALPLAGCSSGRVNQRIEAAAYAGRYGDARVALQKDLGDDASDRAYILNRLRLLILTLADGQPDAAEIVANQTYDLLRTQGLNADRTVSASIINERVKIWKGEPFEQALAYAYIAMQKGERGDWGNSRGAALSSLFLLKDFGENERGEKMTAEDLARRAAQADAKGKNGDAVIDRGYSPTQTNFALGYLLAGTANLALGRGDEASDHFLNAERIDANLAPVAAALRSGRFNTLLVVDYGRGPEKRAYGPDNALVGFFPTDASDQRALRTLIDGAEDPDNVAPAADINAMAGDLSWNNLEDVRTAKSLLGNALLIGGVAVAAADQGRNESDEARKNRALIGAGVAILGGLLKASASADVRHCEFLPQRVYVVPVNIPGPGATLTVEVEGDASSRLVLPNLSPPSGGQRVQLRYLRLTPAGAAWQSAGRLVYANDALAVRVPGDDLPYIFGGRCVRTPTSATMRRYHDAGNLTDLTASDLENIYREEGITFTVEDQRGESAAHILEGGTSLVCPLPGTAGYQRLFGQEHPPYRPRGAALQDYIEQARDRREPAKQ